MKNLLRNRTFVFSISIMMLLAMFVACGGKTKAEGYADKVERISKDYTSMMGEVTKTIEGYVNQSLAKDKALSEFQEEKEEMGKLSNTFDGLEVPEGLGKVHLRYKEAISESLRAMDLLIDGTASQNTERLHEGIRVKQEAAEKMIDANEELTEQL